MNCDAQTTPATPDNAESAIMAATLFLTAIAFILCPALYMRSQNMRREGPPGRILLNVTDERLSIPSQIGDAFARSDWVRTAVGAAAAWVLVTHFGCSKRAMRLRTYAVVLMLASVLTFIEVLGVVMLIPTLA